MENATALNINNSSDILYRHKYYDTRCIFLLRATVCTQVPRYHGTLSNVGYDRGDSQVVENNEF